MAALRLATAAAVVFPLVVHLLVAPSRGHGPALMPLATVGAAALITSLSTPGDLPPGMARDEQVAVAVVDGFWKRHFAEYFGRKYHSPLVVGDYLGGRGPSCDGRRPLSMNAFYCKPQDFLAWDPRLMAAGYGKIGRAWVYLIIAHEWGHTIQARVNRRLVSVASELQADCLAGAELAGAQRDGLLVGEPGDADQIALALTAVADDYPWTKKRDHGDATQRITAYRQGFLGGVPACI